MNPIKNLLYRLRIWKPELEKAYVDKIYTEPKPKYKDTVRNDSKNCQICIIAIGGATKFVCKLCGQAHCSEHRVPETHNCPGKPVKPKDFKSAIIEG